MRQKKDKYNKNGTIGSVKSLANTIFRNKIYLIKTKKYPKPTKQPNS